MTANPNDIDDPFAEVEDDDEATLAASSDAIDEIRAEAARVRSEQQSNFDPSDDPTTLMGDVEPDAKPAVDVDLAEEPTVITGFGSGEEPTVITAADEQADVALEVASGVDEDLTTGAFDAAESVTTVMAKAARGQAPASIAKPAPSTAGAATSLIEGKQPPAAEASYWDRNEIASDVVPQAKSGKGPIPKWFIATALLAVLMAVGLVLLVLWALSGSAV